MVFVRLKTAKFVDFIWLWACLSTLKSPITVKLEVIHKWHPPKNLQILTSPAHPHPPPMSIYVLNGSSSSNRTSRIATPPPLNGKDFLLLKAQFAWKYGQCYFIWYIPIYNKQFRQQNLVTSKFLVKCLLLTASFLNSREKSIHWQGNLSKIIMW